MNKRRIQITISLDPEDLEQVEKIVHLQIYDSLSSTLRAAVKYFLNSPEAQKRLDSRMP